MLQDFYDPEFDACKYTLEQTEGQSLMDLEEFRDARFQELHVRPHAVLLAPRLSVVDTRTRGCALLGLEVGGWRLHTAISWGCTFQFMLTLLILMTS